MTRTNQHCDCDPNGDCCYPPFWDDMSRDHLLNHPAMRYLHHHEDRGCDCNDDQLPVFSRVGRGLQGDGFWVRIVNPDDCTQTYLEGLSYDSASGEWKSEWISDNINGGELSYQYNLRPFTVPQTFTITFIYRRPSGSGTGAMWGYTEDGRFIDMSDGKEVTNPRCCCIGSSPEWGKQLGLPDNCSWSWTTPAIPYIWDADGDGEPDADHMVGCGVAQVYIRTASKDYPDVVNGQTPDDDEWNPRLVFPPYTAPIDYNCPDPEETWSVNITYGLIGGDVLVPHLYDLAQILGWKADKVLRSADHQVEQYQGGIRVDYGHYTFPNDTSDDVKHYIDENDRWLLDHFHKDLGFPDDPFEGDGDGGGLTIYDVLGFDIDYFLAGHTVKEYIDNLLGDLFKKLWWGGQNSNPNQPTPDNPPAGQIKFGDDWTPYIEWTTDPGQHYAVGNMNLYGGDQMENWIRTDVDGDNDAKVR